MLSRLGGLSLAGVALVLVFVIGTIEPLRVAVGGTHVSAAQVLCIIWLAALLATGTALRPAVWGAAALAAVAIYSSLPSVVYFGFGRLSLAGQMTVNLLAFAVAASVFIRLTPRQARAVVLWMALALVALCAVQFAIGAGEAGASARVLNIPRPTAFFSEPTWLGVAVAGLCALSLQQRNLPAVLISLAIVVAVFTRTAVIATAVALMAAGLTSRWSDRELRGLARYVMPVVIGALWALAAWQLWDWYQTPFSVTHTADSLTSRGQDIAVNRQLNGSLFPFGGELLNMYDYVRSRQLPDTSNIWQFELVWKLGAGGLCILVATVALVLAGLPRLTGISLTRLALQPAGTYLLLVVPAAVFNNATGRTWFWLLLGMLAAELARPRRQARPGSRYAASPAIHAESTVSGSSKSGG